jgi:hypothetical protein
LDLHAEFFPEALSLLIGRQPHRLHVHPLNLSIQVPHFLAQGFYEWCPHGSDGTDSSPIFQASLYLSLPLSLACTYIPTHPWSDVTSVQLRIL